MDYPDLGRKELQEPIRIRSLGKCHASAAAGSPIASFGPHKTCNSRKLLQDLRQTTLSCRMEL